MAIYMFLYTGGGMAESEEEQARVMKAWEDWLGSLGEAMVDMGNPFMPFAKKIASNGMVSDGSVGPMATGYTIVSAGSLDQAVELAKGCPGLEDGSEVTVYETFDPTAMM